METKSKPTVEVSAILTKADGTVVDLGVISKTKATPRLITWLKERLNKHG